MTDERLSIEQMAAVLDNAPVAIFVSEIESRKLIYANRLAKSTLLPKDGADECCCYHLAGFAKPCAFCHAGQMGRNELFVREFSHPQTHRIFELSGKIIDWNGKPAHIEYAVDITEKKREQARNEALQNELQTTLSSIPCGLCVYRITKGRISPVFHNPAFYTIMGYSSEHIRAVEQTTDYLGVHPDDLPLLQEKIQKTIDKNDDLRHTYRLWNDQKHEYRWICMEGIIAPQEDGTKLLYGVYSDVSEQKKLENGLTDANIKIQNIVNAIPGGVAIYKVSDILETVYYSDGVPELSGYTIEEYQELIQHNAVEMAYHEDIAMVIYYIRKALQDHTTVDFDFRKQHRDGQIVWVHMQAKQIGQEDGSPLLQCVFHNITELKEAQLELDHLVNSIPGGIASYRVEGDKFIPTFYSDGVMALSGHTREEFMDMIQDDALNAVYEPDRERVVAAAKTALISGKVLDISYRMLHKDGSIIWVHLNGRRLGPLSETMRFYAVFTGMSAEARLYQDIANESADAIYVIDQKNYDLLYVNESKDLFTAGKHCLGQKCYKALHDKDAPCEFCTLQSQAADGQEHEMPVDSQGRFYATRFWETDWNGVPAYIKFVRDNTETVKTRNEKERLEEYFRTVVNNLPGGIAVVRYAENGHMMPEYISDGFAAMTGMSLEEAWEMYRKDAMIGAHPDDLERIREQLATYITSGEDHYELVYRLQKGSDCYIWVKVSFSIIRNQDGDKRLYAIYRDITKEREEQEEVRRQYNDLILQHYRTPGPNALVVGHCNITQNRILEIIDYTNTDPLRLFGTDREAFFTGLGGLIPDPVERQRFFSIYLGAPARAAFERNETVQILECFINLPHESAGRYVQFKMNMVSAPDTEDVTGILTVTDITEQTISNRILDQLSISGHDLVVDLNLLQDRYCIVSCDEKTHLIPPRQGCHTQWVDLMLRTRVVPRDREAYQNNLNPERMLARLQKDGSYTFSFSIVDDNGDIRVKNMTVSAVDLRLGRICLSRSDITASLREQQGLLHMIAYTFDLAGFIDVSSGRLTMYTRQTVLENLPPYHIENYECAIERFTEPYGVEQQKDIDKQFRLKNMLRRLDEKPSGYEFLLPYHTDKEVRYKQINVLWGDQNHRTICLVRADVTDMLMAERKSQTELENALEQARKANRAKSDFLSAMSHDIRTPMNAIMGMTELAFAHLDDTSRVEEYLRKISISSKHLLSLINDVLDMSKIDGSKIELSKRNISLSELLQQLSDMMSPQAKTSGLELTIRTKDIAQPYFYGDPLRINQIFINLLSNAVKFTPTGGKVDFLAEEIMAEKPNAVRYRFTISDTGIGMSPDFLFHLFEPFVRSENTTQIEGTGLGLSITKGLVDLMSGTISVKSQVGKGSVFAVELECEAAQKKDTHSKDLDALSVHPANRAVLSGRCILVAEDNEINAEITCGLLDMFGANYVVKTDGIQTVDAFCQAKQGAYDAILMDIQMPRMNGYEATRIIRGLDRPDAQAIPIIAMTANAFAEDVQLSLAAGMTAHIAKPIDVKTLKNTLCQLLQ